MNHFDVIWVGVFRLARYVRKAHSQSLRLSMFCPFMSVLLWLCVGFALCACAVGLFFCGLYRFMSVLLHARGCQCPSLFEIAWLMLEGKCLSKFLVDCVSVGFGRYLLLLVCYFS
jgi:hypothetical protein